MVAVLVCTAHMGSKNYPDGRNELQLTWPAGQGGPTWLEWDDLWLDVPQSDLPKDELKGIYFDQRTLS
jgi:hypothetical protein